ncbi:hypothetical protein ABZV77_11380 [Streptomyces sp. NPDC004732]|uniref:hypothetical protein n=1 Tax=Streptomyces sp. NPDC004732 TaxID=3154290 RepID=UPI0033B3C658
MSETNGLPDPDEFADYLKGLGFDPIDAQMNEAVQMFATIITKSKTLKKHAQDAGFTEDTSEEMAFSFFSLFTDAARNVGRADD